MPGKTGRTAKSGPASRTASKGGKAAAKPSRTPSQRRGDGVPTRPAASSGGRGKGPANRKRGSSATAAAARGGSGKRNVAAKQWRPFEDPPTEKPSRKLSRPFSSSSSSSSSSAASAAGDAAHGHGSPNASANPNSISGCPQDAPDEQQQQQQLNACAAASPDLSQAEEAQQPAVEAAPPEPGSTAAILATLNDITRRASEHARRPGQPQRQRRGGSPRIATADDIATEMRSIQVACDFGLDMEEECQRRACECGVPLLGPWMAAAPQGISSSSTGNDGGRRRTLGELSAATLLLVMAYCPVPALVQLSRANRRLAVLARHRGLWATHVAAAGIQSGGDIAAMTSDELRAILRRRVEARRLRGEAEVAECEMELQQLQQRMAARTEADLRDSVNVDRILAAHHPDAILYGNVGQFGGRGRGKDAFAGGEELLRQLCELEAARGGIMDAIEEGKRALAEQQAVVAALSSRLERIYAVGGSSGGNAKTGDGGAVNDSNSDKVLVSSSTTTGAAAARADAVVGGAFVSFDDVAAFERRVSRLIVNGGFNSNVAVEAALAEALPLALRRGVTDFGTLELLVAHCDDDEDEDDADAAPGSAARKALLARWHAFLAFLPLNEDYYLARQFLQHAQYQQRQQRQQSSDDGDALPVIVTATDDGGALVVPRRMEAVLLRLTGVVRKVASMTDTEIVRVVL